MALPPKDPTTPLGCIKDVQIRFGPQSCHIELHGDVDEFLLSIGDEYLATVTHTPAPERGHRGWEVTHLSETLMTEFDSGKGYDYRSLDTCIQFLLWDRYIYHHGATKGYGVIYLRPDGEVTFDTVDGASIQDGIDFVRLIASEREGATAVLFDNDNWPPNTHRITRLDSDEALGIYEYYITPFFSVSRP